MFLIESQLFVIIGEWPALKVFSLDYFAKLYDGIPGAYQSVEDECQFLPFKTDFLSLRDALEAGSHSKREPWYIGWYVYKCVYSVFCWWINVIVPLFKYNKDHTDFYGLIEQEQLPSESTGHTAILL